MCHSMQSTYPDGRRRVQEDELRHGEHNQVQLGAHPQFRPRHNAAVIASLDEHLAVLNDIVNALSKGACPPRWSQIRAISSGRRFVRLQQCVCDELRADESCTARTNLHAHFMASISKQLQMPRLGVNEEGDVVHPLQDIGGSAEIVSNARLDCASPSGTKAHSW